VIECLCPLFLQNTVLIYKLNFGIDNDIATHSLHSVVLEAEAGCTIFLFFGSVHHQSFRNSLRLLEDLAVGMGLALKLFSIIVCSYRLPTRTHIELVLERTERAAFRDYTMLCPLSFQ